MSIFTNLEFTRIEECFRLHKRFEMQMTLKKVIGEVKSHTIYQEISEDLLKSQQKVNIVNEYYKFFCIYRYTTTDDTFVVIIRADGVHGLNDRNLIEFDCLQIKKAQRYIKGKTNYCVDDVFRSTFKDIEMVVRHINKLLVPDCMEIPSSGAEAKNIMDYFENFDFIASGNWKRKRNSIVYFGHHVKNVDYKNIVIENAPFIMLNEMELVTTKQAAEKITVPLWSKDEFDNFIDNVVD